ncbi:MAG: alpha/beta fold hydrolase [Chloracidobacterium sp.]|uniref:Alpha/beta hydrolase n=1 Tax=Chloracidobacterium validum TaxID=2821543 RepID=A0ABX8BBC6_9BACT|nr:alpha/beta fold hydrolase [Chloracidobacterium validum]QUW03707.1 alpha/beta hydrolase [Chloracidobacterium validum]
MSLLIAERLFRTLFGEPTGPLDEDGYVAENEAGRRRRSGAARPLHYELLLDAPTLKLRRYAPRRRLRRRLPVLLVPPLMVTADVFDLHPRRSLVRHLVEQGYDVFLLDYGKPQARDRRLSLGRYIEHRVHTGVRMVKRVTGTDELSLVGYCLGGIFANCYAALHPQSGIRNIVTIGTPTDFSAMLLHRVLAGVSRQPLEALAAHYGYIPAAVCNASFHLLHPDVVLRSPKTFWRGLSDPDFIASPRPDGGRHLEYVNLTEAAFKQLWHNVVLGNELAAGRFTIGRRRVDYGRIRAASLIIASREDRLVPPEAVTAITKTLTTKDVAVRFVKGGHLGMLIGSRAGRTWRLVAEWLEVRSRRQPVAPAKPSASVTPWRVVPLPAAALPSALRKVS